jgi:hypothetical protein
MFASAAAGIKPRSAWTSHTASSTSSQRAYFPSSEKIRAISGREYRSIKRSPQPHEHRE